jgi:hypothetical protein
LVRLSHEDLVLQQQVDHMESKDYHQVSAVDTSFPITRFPCCRKHWFSKYKTRCINRNRIKWPFYFSREYFCELAFESMEASSVRHTMIMGVRSSLKLCEQTECLDGDLDCLEISNCLFGRANLMKDNGFFKINPSCSYSIVSFMNQWLQIKHKINYNIGTDHKKIDPSKKCS